MRTLGLMLRQATPVRSGARSSRWSRTSTLRRPALCFAGGRFHSVNHRRRTCSVSLAPASSWLVSCSHDAVTVHGVEVRVRVGAFSPPAPCLVCHLPSACAISQHPWVPSFPVDPGIRILDVCGAATAFPYLRVGELRCWKLYWK
jgi:hypothetical protein